MKNQGIEKIIDILGNANEREYIGEPISQLEHALQCAHFAEKCKGTEEVILACLFHDIGHLCAPAGSPEMDGLGIVDHEKIGGEFLQKIGFSDLIIDLVENHVQGKRYLCFKNPSYYKQLSPASKGTLDFQGGPMSEEEANQYENHEFFEQRILVRRCDEMAKKKDLTVAPLEDYVEMMQRHIVR